MTTNTSIGNTHKSPLYIPYTGTADQPDTVTLFSLQGKGPVHFKDEQTVNSIGHSPFYFMAAVLRIQVSAQKIISEIRQGAFRENSELGNAFKNFFRGVVQLVPIAGNAALYAYDYLKIHLYTHSLIPDQLSCGGYQMGIAFDGKVVAKFSYDQFKRAMKINEPDRDVEDPVCLLAYLWAASLKKAIEQDATHSRLDIAQSLAENIQRA